MSSPRPELRIGDAERDAVTEVLREAVAQGRLTLDELEDRLEAALAARTLADLDPLVADLPVDLPSATARTQGQASPRRRTGPGWSGDDPLVLDPGWSSLGRTGRWDIPPYLRLHSSMGVLKLDCLQASAPGDTIDVAVVAGSGVMTIVVPDSWGADRDRLQSRWGTARLKVSARPDTGAPLMVLHGSVGLGVLTVRHAGWFERRRLARQGVGRPQRALER